MSKRKFEYKDGSSNKFWTINLEDCRHTITYGRIGSSGQTKTKDFTSPHEAQEAHDKLIREKLKEGYIELSPPWTTPASAPLTPPTATPSPKETLRVAVLELQEQGEETDEPGLPSPEILQLMDNLGYWRSLPLQALPVPEPTPFDKEAALAAQRIHAPGAWAGEAQSAFIQSVRCSREEAHFWFLVFVNSYGTSGKLAAEAVAQVEPDGKISLDEVTKYLSGDYGPTGYLHNPSLTWVLWNLLSLDDFFSLLTQAEHLVLAGPPIMGNGQYKYHPSYSNRNAIAFLAGFEHYVWPYLTQPQANQLRTKLRPLIAPGQRTETWHSPSYGLRLAAKLGLWPELRKVVEGWPAPDENYSKYDYIDPRVELVFRLGGNKWVEKQVRRLQLFLSAVEHVEALALLYTGRDRLTLLMDSILQEGCDLTHLFNVLVRDSSPEIAPHILELSFSRRLPTQAREWLENNRELAVIGLLPLATGRGRQTEAAVEWLRTQKRLGYANLIEKELNGFLPTEASRLGNLLGSVLDGLSAFDDTTTPPWLQRALAQVQPLPKYNLPSWLELASLPSVQVASYRLDLNQVENFLLALQQSSLATPHPLVVAIKLKATPASLTNFAWAIFQAWLSADTPPKEKWLLQVIGLLGDDKLVVKLAPLVRTWSIEGNHQRAVQGLECLRTIGSDIALLQINSIAHKSEFKALKKRAQECLTEIAQARNLSREELEDRIISDCEMDEQGST